MKKYLVWILLSVPLWAQVENPPSGNGVGVYVVASLPVSPVTGTVAVVTDGNSATDCTVGGGSTLVLCRFDGAAWGTFPAGSATAGGSNTQLQYNSANALAGAAQWTTNGTTITAGASGVLNLGSSPVLTGLVLPKGATAAPIIEGQAAFNTTSHLPVWGFNGASTTTIPVTIANASHKWLNSYDQSTGAFTQTQPAISDLTATFSLPLSLSTNTLSCPTCVVATTPGAGVAHFAGSTQTVTSSAVVAADTDTSIAHTGVDINTSYQVTATHLASPLSLLQGGTATAAATAADAFNALAPTTAKGGIIIGTGVNTYGNVAVGSTGDCLVVSAGTWAPGSCATGSVGAGAGLTTGKIPKATASLTLGDSNTSDNGTLTTIAGSGGVNISQGPLVMTAVSAPTGTAGSGWIWYDVTATRLQAKNGNNTAVNLVISGVDINTSDQVTATHLASPLPSAQGGTANAFFTVSGPATSAKTFTFPNASATVLTTNAAVTAAQGGTGTDLSAATAGRYPKANGSGAFVASTLAASGTGSCTNQAVTALNGDAAPSCTTLTSAYVNNTIALTGVDINTSNQVTGLNGTSLAGLATGILKNTTGTGVPSIAIAGDFPTLNQNTTGSSAKWTTARTLAGNSVDGSANVAFNNKFIVQGTVDAGLSGAQFLGALSTGLMKNTTTTGVVSIATAADVDSLYTGAGKCYLFKGTSPGSNDGCDTPPGTLSGLTSTQVLVATSATTATSYAGFTSDTSGNVTANSFTSSDTSHAGFIGIGQGPAQSIVANTVGLTGGTAITGYNIVFPSAASSGFMKFTNVANVVTAVFDAAINLTSCTDCTGVLPTANGGTGANTLTNHAPLLGAGTSAVNPMAVGGLGTTIIGQGASADPIWSATLTLGVAGTTSGSFVLANGGVGGANITLQNNIVTSSYNWNFPSSAGTAGQCLTSGGGGASAMTWGSCGGGTPAWDTITAPTTSNLSLSMATHTTTFTYGDQGASASTALFTVTDSASTSTDRSLNIVADTGGSSNHVPFVARYRGSDALKVCPAVGSVTGVAVVGAVIACETINSVNATPIAKFLVESATNAHTTARFYQNGAAQTGNGVEIFTKTAAGTGFNSLLIKTSCTDGDTTCAAGTAQFTVRGDGLLTVNNSVSATTFTSTQATGTAPFTVSSTTNVANLNASSLSGATFAAPGAIGGGTPSTGAFTSLTGTSSITLGANGGTGGSVVLNGSTSGSATINTSATGVLALPSGTTATSMALTTPSLGAATATTINLVTITQPAASATLTIANTKTLTATNTMDVSKTAGVAGAIPWYDTTTSQSATALLTANAVMIGGGASAAPSTISADTTTTHALFATAGAPAFRAIAAGDLPGTLSSGTAITNAALTTPSIGAATGTSLYATGIIDGKATMNVSTTTPCTLGTAGTNCSAVSSLQSYNVNEHATAATAITYNLPTAAAGLQYCVANGYNGTAANTGVLTVATSASGQFIIFTDGTISATGGNVTSGGAGGDAACFVGVDTTHWMMYVNRGTWTKH